MPLSCLPSSRNGSGWFCDCIVWPTLSVISEDVDAARERGLGSVALRGIGWVSSGGTRVLVEGCDKGGAGELAREER